MTWHGLTAFERFMRYVDADGECWTWTGPTNTNGYGVFRLTPGAGGTVSAHRASWVLHNGAIHTPRTQVCHRCDNRRCVNPAHLWLGSASDNIRDAVAKGRKVGYADWTRARRLREGGASQRAIARDIGVSHTAVQKAARRGWI